MDNEQYETPLIIKDRNQCLYENIIRENYPPGVRYLGGMELLKFPFATLWRLNNPEGMGMFFIHKI